MHCIASDSNRPSFWELYEENYAKAENEDFILYNTAAYALDCVSKVSMGCLVGAAGIVVLEHAKGKNPLANAALMMSVKKLSVYSAVALGASKVLRFALPHISAFGRATLAYNGIMPQGSQLYAGLQKDFNIELQKLKSCRENETLSQQYPICSHFLLPASLADRIKNFKLPSLGPLTFIAKAIKLPLDTLESIDSTYGQVSLCLSIVKVYSSFADRMAAFTSICTRI